MSDATSGVFHYVRARYVAAAWLILPFYTPGLEPFLRRFGMEWPDHWWQLVAGLYGHALLVIAVLASVAAAWPIPVRSMLGRVPMRSELMGGAKLTAFLMLASIATAYGLFYPLSYIAPDFVTWWYIQQPNLVFFDGDGFPLIANAVSLLWLCVLVPVVEECVFRGLILPRWTHKWGLRPGLLASSALFAVVHADPIGAFLFAAGMSALYLRSQSLLLPMFCHALNNFVVWILAWVDIAIYGPDVPDTLQDFRNEWYWGAGTAVAALAWLYAWLQRPRSAINWKFPVT